jgi:RNA-directed DNA polymerase
LPTPRKLSCGVDTALRLNLLLLSPTSHVPLCYDQRRATHDPGIRLNTKESATDLLALIAANAARNFFKNTQTKEGLANALGMQFRKHLVYYLYRLPPEKRYESFKIKKKDGTNRPIQSPRLGLKLAQERLSKIPYNVYEADKGIHGYVIGRGPTTNAEAHVRQRFVLNVDLDDFFGSINFGRVRGMLLARPYLASEEVATVVAQICCHENKLPQGAPTSPVVSNMICRRMDGELKKLAQEFGCYYTRYSDDLTFSSSSKEFSERLAFPAGAEGSREIVVGDRLAGIIKKNGFSINVKKTRLLTPADRQDVTGLVVNRFVNVERRYIRNIRAALHACEKFGLDAAQKTFLEQKHWRSRPYGKTPKLMNVLFGRIQYVGHVRGFDDDIYKKLRNAYNDLSLRKIPVSRDSWEAKLESNVWVLEDEDSTLQGTAFFLEGYGLVTSRHCVGTSPFIYHPQNHANKFAVEVSKTHKEIDLAILKVKDPTEFDFAELAPQPFQSQIGRGDDILLAGFPSHAPGKGLSVKEGKVQSIVMRSAIRWFSISALIIGGNSGGPVLNRARRVVGVAITGADNESAGSTTEDHGVIPIAALAYLTTEQDRPKNNDDPEVKPSEPSSSIQQNFIAYFWIKFIGFFLTAIALIALGWYFSS